MGIFITKPNADLKLKLTFKLIDGLYLNRGTRLELYNDTDYLTISDLKKSYNLNMKYENIINISFDLYNEEIIEKKSVVKRAIVAGALTGGLGSIIGALSGIGTKKKINKMQVLYIEYLDVVDQTKNLLILQPDVKFLIDNFIEAIRRKMNNTHIDTDLIKNSIDIPTQILKLSELKEKNIISNEDFEAKKADLLSRI